MNQNNENISVEQFYRTAALVWLALLSSQIVFAIVVFAVKPELFKFDFSKSLLGENPPIIMAFIAIAFMSVVLSVVMRISLIKKGISEQKLNLVQTGMIVGCALAETASILGLILAFSFSYQYFFIPMIIGVIGILIHFPQRKNFIDASYGKKL